jgi:hypothetical protein
MKKICILANSHIGAVTRGMKQLPNSNIEHVTKRIDFYRFFNLQGNLYYENGLLKPKNGDMSYYLHQDFGNYHINLQDYDCVVSYGGRLMSNPDGWIQHVKDYVSDQYSSAVLHQSHIDDIESSQAVMLLKDIAASNVYTGKIIIIPSPIPNEMHWAFNPLKTVIPEYMDYIENIYQDYFSHTPIEFSALPRELLSENGYAVHARFKTDTPKDFMHLNDSGGALVAHKLINLIADMT